MINCLEFCNSLGYEKLLIDILNKISIKGNKTLSFKLQIQGDGCRPDALISLTNTKVYIESKVQAPLDLDQIQRHLELVEKQEFLLIITNKVSDKEKLFTIKDQRLRFLTWGEVYSLAHNCYSKIKNSSKDKAAASMLQQFVEYLEVVTLTDFNGFREEDFDFFIQYNPYYLPILKKKMESLAEYVKQQFSSELEKYSHLIIGNIPKKMTPDVNSWVAIQNPDLPKSFQQCNFTVSLDRDSFMVNAIIRNGSPSKKGTPINAFLNVDDNKLLSLFKKVADLEKKHNEKYNAIFQICERVSRYGGRLMPGNEQWNQVSSFRLDQINSIEDVKQLKHFMSKPDYPGVRIMRKISRGDQILSDKEKLGEEIRRCFREFKPFLEILNEVSK